MSDTAIAVAITGDEKGLVKAVQVSEKQLQQFADTTRNVFNKVKESWLVLGTKVSIYTTALKNVGGAISKYIISPMKDAVNSFVSLGDQLSKTSQRLGVSVDALGGLKFASEQCGSSFEELTNGLRAFQNILGGAQMGDTGMLEKLRKNGLNLADFEGLSNEAQFLKIADHIAAIGDKSEQTRVALELFGEAGFKLLPLFQEGSAGIKKLMAEGERMGAVMGEEGAARAVALADAMNRMKTSFANISNQIVSKLAPAITSLCDTLAQITPYILKIITLGAEVVAWAIAAKLAFTALAIAHTTSFTAMGAACVGLKAKFAGLWKLIAANGPLLALLGLGAAITALYHGFQKVRNAALEAAKASADASLGAAEAAKEHADAVKRVNSEDQHLLDRLKELSEQAEKDPLMKGELEEAQALVAALTDRYGDLGLSIDATIGKVSGLAAAQEKMLQIQMNAHKLALEQELANLQQEKRDIARAFKEAGNTVTFASVWESAKNTWAGLTGGKQKELSAVTAVEEQYGPRVTEIMRREGDLYGELAKLDPEKYESYVEEDLSAEDDAPEPVKTTDELAAMEAENRARKELVESANAPEVDKRISEAQQEYDRKREAHAAAKFVGGKDTVDAAKKELDKAQQDLYRAQATVSGETRQKAREEQAEAQAAWDTAVEEGVSLAKLTELKATLDAAKKKVEDADKEYFDATGRLEVPKEATYGSKYVEEVVEGRSRGTFSAFGIDAVIGDSIQQQTLDEVKKICTIVARIEEGEEGFT